MDKCEEVCIDEMVDCLLKCENVECESQCRRTLLDCNDGKQLLLGIVYLFYLACPCMPDCYDGCKDCDNPVCTCSVSNESTEVDALK